MPKPNESVLFHEKKPIKTPSGTLPNGTPSKPSPAAPSSPRKAHLPRASPLPGTEDSAALPDGPFKEYKFMSSASNGWKYDVMKFDSAPRHGPAQARTQLLYNDTHCWDPQTPEAIGELPFKRQLDVPSRMVPWQHKSPCNGSLSYNRIYLNLVNPGSKAFNCILDANTVHSNYPSAVGLRPRFAPSVCAFGLHSGLRP
ncbi:hypothetical protein CONPUDRAFT_160304 [Coniophora puteana RWD-64-598 SS2]|uniref:Uncharacterized protein n=1 Tax=Coniophora puteana (strain RWD-64-598) TaxID=741705 RepID=R7SEI8_CONPW|nr:uncharacterized protein CONPUDRAFT_160304 [Coniophora puteana RWD-64-598 SS2]EIW74260.1 hypothetical protein CONPUDRAFT_160304 [Coniophora puteana RWD-64-598 SS2]